MPIENISKNVSICPKSKMNNLRTCLVDKNNSLVYYFENKVVFIVTIIDNKSHHQY